MMTMPFGKHRGEPLDEVPRDYLRWVLLNCTRIGPGLRQAIEDVLWPAGRPGASGGGCGSPGARDAAGARAGAANAGSIAMPDLEQALKTWFRELVLLYHPDRGGEHAAMVAVTDARDRLYRALGLPTHGR